MATTVPDRTTTERRESPYQGLVPYATEDAEYFFGRDTERQIIASNLISSRLTIVYGESGVGKTSLLRAGVVVDLLRRSKRDAETGAPEFFVMEFATWRDAPTAGLQAAIAASVRDVLGDRTPTVEVQGGLAETLEAWSDALDADLLLILDQFEEYFLYHAEEQGPESFGEELRRAVARQDLRANFLISIRADALHYLDKFKGKIDRLFGNLLRVEALDREAAESTIRKPVERWNSELPPGESPLEIEPGLVDAVLDQVQAGRVTPGQAGAGTVDGEGVGTGRIEAPYLQLVMSRLWNEETAAGSRVLRLATLAMLGGAERIVLTHLDEVMSKLTPSERDMAAKIFNFLVTPSGTKIAHTAETLAYYAKLPEPELKLLLERLAGREERILRAQAALDETGPASYEIFHDVLAAAILDWRNRYQQVQEQAESQRHLEEEKHQAEARARAARRRATRSTAIAGISLILAALVGVLAIWAIGQRSSARRATSTAQSEADAGQAFYQLTRDPADSVRLAMRGLRSHWTQRAENALRESLPISRVEMVLNGHGGAVNLLRYSSDGTELLAVGDDHAVRIWDPRTGRLLHTLRGHSAAINDAEFSPNGRYVATASNDKTVRIWDARSGSLLHRLGMGSPAVKAVFSPNSARLLVATHGAGASVWSVPTGRRTSRVMPGSPTSSEWIDAVAFSSKGDRVVTGDGAGSVCLYGASTGRALWRSCQSTGASYVNVVAFNHRGTLIGSGDSLGVVKLFRTSNGKEYLKLGTGVSGAQVSAIEFSRDDANVLAAAGKRAFVFQSSNPPAQLSSLVGHSDYVYDATFSPDGNYVVTASADGTARVWNAATGTSLFVLRGHSDVVWDARFSPDGRTVATAGQDGTVRMWSIATGTQLVPATARLLDTGAVLAAAFSPDGSKVVTAGGATNGTIKSAASVRLWSASTGKQLAGPNNAGTALESVAFSPDGATVIGGTQSGYVVLWSATDLHLIHFWRVRDHNAVREVAYTSGGDRIFAATEGSGYGDVYQWDAGAVQASGTSFQIRPPPQSALRITNIVNASVSGGGLVAAVLNTGKVQVSQNGKLLYTVPNAFRLARFSDDGRYLVTDGPADTARVWAAQTGRPVAILSGSNNGVTQGAAFGPKDAWVAAGTEDGSMFVWSLPSGNLLAELREQSDYINSVDVRTTDGAILTASDDHTAKIYSCTTCGPLAGVEQQATAYLRRLGPPYAL